MLRIIIIQSDHEGQLSLYQGSFIPKERAFQTFVDSLNFAM